MFSYFKGALDMLVQRMLPTGLEPLRLDGSLSLDRRAEVVRAFRDDPRVRPLSLSPLLDDGQMMEGKARLSACSCEAGGAASSAGSADLLLSSGRTLTMAWVGETARLDRTLSAPRMHACRLG